MQTLLKRNPGRDQNVYDEGIGVSHVPCRYAKFDLPLGESIMLNHALVGGLLKSKATPVTDDDFHAMVLEHKIRRAQRNPEIREILNDRWSSTSVAQSQLVASVFTDRGIELPCLSSNVPIESILKYRNDHDAELQAARKELEWLAREIQHTPLTQEFADHLHHTAIGRVNGLLQECKKARDSWVRAQRPLVLEAAGVAIATAALFVAAPPALPIAVVLAWAGKTALPTLELLQEWSSERAQGTANGLHYLLKVK